MQPGLHTSGVDHLRRIDLDDTWLDTTFVRVSDVM